MITIYTLSCPIQNKIMYVGSTKYSLKKRLSLHLYSRSNKRKTLWINFLRIKGLQPLIEQIDFVKVVESDFYENFWIQQIKAWGFELLNIREPKHRK